jgi:hypothetical protein
MQNIVYKYTRKEIEDDQKQKDKEQIQIEKYHENQSGPSGDYRP